MSAKSLFDAIQDRRFTGELRLCWFAFGDNGGRAGVVSVCHWANCDEDVANQLIQRLVDGGHAFDEGNGVFVAPALLPSEPDSPKRKERRGPSISKKRRERIYDDHGRACRYCGKTEGPLEIDHVIPVSRGGTNGDDNLAVACKSCNCSKGNRLLEEWSRQ